MVNYCLILVREKIRSIKAEFGVSILINTAIALIITAFILVPNLKTFATTMTGDMTDWYNSSIKTVLFKTSN